MIEKNKAELVFNRLLKYPWLIILTGVLVVAGTGAQLGKMKIDTSIEAYIPKGHQSLVDREHVRQVFGLSDPIVVAVTSATQEGIFTPHRLNFIMELTDRLRQVEGVDPEKITSIASENNIYGTDSGLMVEPFLENRIETQEEAMKIRTNILQFPLYVGSLVSKDASTTLIIVELLDKNKYGQQAYYEIKELSESFLAEQLPDGSTEVYVAGEGGVVAYMATYIDGDAKKMTPLAFVVIIFVIVIAYRTFRGLYLSLFVIIGAVVSAMGIMAATGVPMYLSSNIIPVILIAISVADAIHILGQYYEILAKHPEISSREAVMKTMSEMWRPVLFTSLTNIGSFLALSVTSSNPPMQMIGIFSSVGVFVALLFSLLLVPAVLILLKPKVSKAYQGLQGNTIKTDIFGKLMVSLGASVMARSKLIMVTAALVFVISLYGVTKVYVDEASINNFNKETHIYKADQLIGAKMNGVNSFDVMIEASTPQGLYKPDNLKKVENLQKHLEQLPQVGGTTSIVDIVKQMNKALNENNEEAYSIPEDEDMVAQLFLLYSASGNPADLEQFIDYDYRYANIAVTLKDGKYTSVKKVIEPLNSYLAAEFNDNAIHAKIAGWMNVFYYWLDDIGFSNFLGMVTSVLVVIGMTAYSFRSVIAGLYVVTPVVFALSMFYAVMGYTGITLSTSTAIFGPIAIGVAVDFAIHIIEAMLLAIKQKGLSIDEALHQLFPSAGRALLFNVTAICLGFGANMISSLPPFVVFGMLITTCVGTSFLVSITLLPAMLKTFKPRFLFTGV